MDIPEDWAKIDVGGIAGVVLVIGASDTGKSTFTRYLYQRLRETKIKTAYLDGDPGQSSLGPPTTITLSIEADEEEGEAEEPPPAVPSPEGQNPPSPEIDGPGWVDDPPGRTGSARELRPASRAAQKSRIWRSFIGSTSPSGHWVALLTGAARLVKAAYQAGSQVILYDTCGLIDPDLGGLSLKLAKIDLLHPSLVIAIQRDRELEPLLKQLRRSRRTQVFDLAPSNAVQPRSSSKRRKHRARQYARYFGGAAAQEIAWRKWAIFPAPHFQAGLLFAFEDFQGFTLALGLVEQVNRERKRLKVITPLHSFDQVDALRLGDTLINFETYQDQRI